MIQLTLQILRNIPPFLSLFFSIQKENAFQSIQNFSWTYKIIDLLWLYKIINNHDAQLSIYKGMRTVRKFLYNFICLRFIYKPVYRMK